MSVLLLILKIIGIVLLVILALLILLIVGILFVPYVYRVKGSFHGKPDLTASIYGLGHLVGAGVILTDTGAQMYLRICGIRKFLHSGNKEDETGNTDQYEETVNENPKPEKYEDLAIQEVSKTQKTETDDVTSADDMVSPENEIDVFSAGNVQTSESESDFRDEAETDQRLSIWKRLFKKIRSFGKSIARIPEKIRNLIAKIKNFFYTLKHAFSNLKKTIRKIKRLLTDESHKRAFAKVKTSVWQLLKILMPHRLKLNLEYSTGSPDTTAQILGILAMFPIGYQNRWNVHPDFTADNAYAEAEFDVKGRIFGVSLLKLILGLVLDKDCQKLYNQFKTMKA